MRVAKKINFFNIFRRYSVIVVFELQINWKLKNMKMCYIRSQKWEPQLANQTILSIRNIVEWKVCAKSQILNHINDQRKRQSYQSLMSVLAFTSPSQLLGKYVNKCFVNGLPKENYTRKRIFSLLKCFISHMNK